MSEQTLWIKVRVTDEALLADDGPRIISEIFAEKARYECEQMARLLRESGDSTQ